MPPALTGFEVSSRLPSIIQPNCAGKNRKSGNFEDAKSEKTEIPSHEEHVPKKAPIYEEVMASQPNLNAQPKKPALKKPGQPSRFRGKITRKKSLRSSENSETDSDSDIRYSSDENDDFFAQRPLNGLAIGRWGSSVADRGTPRSTNPAIASKIVLRPSMKENKDMCSTIKEEDDEEEIEKVEDDGDSTIQEDEKYGRKEMCDTIKEEGDEEEEEVEINNAFASKIKRKDTMAGKLDSINPINDIPDQTPDERRKLMHKISIKLER